MYQQYTDKGDPETPSFILGAYRRVLIALTEGANSPYVYLCQDSQFHPQALLSMCGLVNLKKNKLPKHLDIKNSLLKTTGRWQRFRKFLCKWGDFSANDVIMHKAY